MGYIDYSTYAKLGGTVTASVFSNFERQAERLLDFYTQNRIRSLTEISTDLEESINECMVGVIDHLSSRQGDKVASFSNDGISVSFDNSISDEQKLYKIIEFYLPADLIHAGVD